MKNKELLVVRCTINLKPKEYDVLMECIQVQKSTGTVLLPSYCEAIVVPEDIDIRSEAEWKVGTIGEDVQSLYPMIYCSHCKQPTYFSKPNYCPHCGAKMKNPIKPTEEK